MATDGSAGRISSSGEKSLENANPAAVNKFSNDGSFLEMFKKKMEEQNKMKNEKKESENTSESHVVSPPAQNDSPVNSEGEASNSEPSTKKPNIYPFVGKRRGGAPVLKTGAVKKQKKEEAEPAPTDSKDAWARYLQEVQKYKSQSCQDEDRTRPLVK